MEIRRGQLNLGRSAIFNQSPKCFGFDQIAHVPNVRLFAADGSRRYN
jgi:hypothetical protein